MRNSRLISILSVQAAAVLLIMAQPVFTSGQGTRMYENPEQGFQIRIQEGWRIEPEQTEDQFRFSASGADNRTGLYVWVKQNLHPVDSDKFITAWEDSASGNSPLFEKRQPGQPFPALTVDEQGTRMVFREYTGIIDGEAFRTYAGYTAKGTRGYVAIAYFPDGNTGLERRARGDLLSFRLVEAPPAPQAGDGYRTIREDKFGFIIDIPGNWSYRLTEGRDYMITGPSGTTAAEVRVVLQFISKQLNRGSSAAAQLAEARQQLTGDGARVEREGKIDVAGGASPFLVAALDAADARGRTVPHGYILVVLDHGAHYTWVTYSGPAQAYEAHGPVFQKMLNSFRFLR